MQSNFSSPKQNLSIKLARQENTPFTPLAHIYTPLPPLHFLHCTATTTMTSSNTTTTTTPLLSSDTFSSFRRSFIPEIQTLELILAASIFLTIHSLRQRRHLGLVSWPVIGMLPSLLNALSCDNVYEWLTDVLIERGGTFTFRGPWFTSLQCVLTSDPRNLEHLLKTKFTNFPKGHYFRNTVRDLLGDGIFGVDDETWKRQRRTASIEFHSAEFRAMTAESLYELVHSRLLPVLESAYKERQEIDMQDVLLRLTFDNVCIIAFGTDPGCLAQGLPEVPFARAFEDATEATIIRFITPTTIWHTCRFLNIGNERRLKRSLKAVDGFAYEVIKNRRKELALEGTKGKSDLLTVFMGLKDEDGKEYSEKFLRDICVNFILAGRDTSSVALAWFFWLLEKNRDVEEKIVEEVRKIVKEREGGGENDNGDVVFKPEEIKKMEYLQAALSEALRLYPSVPVDHKQVVDDEVFPDGTVLKGGTKIIYAIYSMGRMESIWGEDCREYKPERWLKDGRFMSESAYKFTAFNGGPRLCLGKDFAYYQMKYVVASILYRYHVKVVENHPVTPKLALTMYMKHGLKVTLEKRET